MNSRSTSPLYLAVLLAILAAGCAVKRPYVAPAAGVPSAWSASMPAATGGDETLAAWWNAFGDRQLTSIVQRAVAGNLDVRTAVSRVREARASVRGARAPLTPSVDASGTSRVSGSGSNGNGGAGGAGGGNTAGFAGTSQSYSLGLDASWELDVFGGIRSSVDAAAATAEARSADLQDVLVSLAAEVVLDYIDVRSGQRRLEISRSNVALQEQTLDLTRLRQQAGLGTELEVQQALSNVENTRAQIALLEGQVVRSVHALSVLLGQAPGTLAAELSEPGPIPSAPLSVAVGVPADAIRRRPDVRGAERQLAAQAAQVNVARADLYPTFRLAGSIGLESLSIAKLFVPGAGSWSANPSVSTRLFNRGQLRENLAVQGARETQAAVTYQARVLGALQDVEDSLTSLAQEDLRRGHLSAAADAAQQTADLSLQLYTAGLRDFRDVLDAQRSLLTLQDSLASSTATVSTDLVRLYKALGGGWSADALVPRE